MRHLTEEEYEKYGGWQIGTLHRAPTPPSKAADESTDEPEHFVFEPDLQNLSRDPALVAAMASERLAKKKKR